MFYPQYLTAVHTITDIDTNGGKPIFTAETEVKGGKVSIMKLIKK